MSLFDTWNLPNPHPSSDNISIGDIAGLQGGLALLYRQLFGGLQGQSADIFGQALSGQVPGAVAPLISGRLAQTASAIPQAQRQASDSMSGGNLQQTLGQIAQAGIGQRAQGTQDVLGQLVSGGLNIGQQFGPTMSNLLQAPGMLRVGEKAASQKKGGLF